MQSSDETERCILDPRSGTEAGWINSGRDGSSKLGGQDPRY